MSDDDEINAMKHIASAMEPLDDPARTRVLQWAVSRFRGQSPGATFDQPSTERSATLNGTTQRYETFAELFEDANASTDREKALVAAYWAQVCQGQPSFASQMLNDALKDLGHGVGNITEALSALKDERPALVLQLKKSGTSRQARKTYKLTQEGIRRVQSMLRGEDSSGTE